VPKLALEMGFVLWWTVPARIAVGIVVTNLRTFRVAYPYVFLGFCKDGRPFIFIFESLGAIWRMPHLKDKDVDFLFFPAAMGFSEVMNVDFRIALTTDVTHYSMPKSFDICVFSPPTVGD